MCQLGKPPASEARSPTRGTLISNASTAMVTSPIAINGAGIILVIRGVIQIMAIVAATRISVSVNSAPASQLSFPEASVVLNCSSCASPMTIASPFTKPSITGCGTMRMNLPHLSTPAIICKTPIRTTVANRYSAPCVMTSETITTARAPVAPDIMPGLPPMTAVISPTIKAAYNPASGASPATNAKATASGTRANETVKPDNRSMLVCRDVMTGCSAPECALPNKK